MDTIHNWITSNHLQLNATKTELLNINANSNLDNFPILYIDSSPLTPSSTVTYLGITLNPALYYDDHITSIIKTTSHFQYNIRKIRPFIDFTTAKLLMHSFKRTIVLSKLLQHISHWFKKLPLLLNSTELFTDLCEPFTN